jgi:replicative DNA helicase
MIDTETALPHAHGPEKAILSCMMQDIFGTATRMEDIGFNTSMFYSQSHILLASVLEELAREGLEFDLTIFIQKLIDKSLVDHVGGYAAVTEIRSYCPSLSQLETQCGIVKTKYIERELLKLGHSNQQQDITNLEDASKLLANNSSVITSLEESLHRKADTSVKGAIQSVMNKFQALIVADDPADLYGHRTGFNKLDSMIMGLNGGEVFVVGARPSMGKTAFMMNVVDSVCITQKIPTLVFSCEMGREALINRAMFGRAGFDYRKMTVSGHKYTPKKNELISIKKSWSEYNESPLHIDDRSALSIEEIRSAAKTFHKKHGIKFIAIDYLQLLKSTSKKAQFSKEVEVSEISAGVKSIAKDLNIPILILSQLNRAPSGSRGTSAPKMADLRNSGSIEQDADIIGLLHRHDYENSGERIGEAEINIAKNRNGPTDRLPLTWQPEFQRFIERHEER